MNETGNRYTNEQIKQINSNARVRTAASAVFGPNSPRSFLGGAAHWGVPEEPLRAFFCWHLHHQQEPLQQLRKLVGR